MSAWHEHCVHTGCQRDPLNDWPACTLLPHLGIRDINNNCLLRTWNSPKVTPSLPWTQHQTSKDGFNTFHVSSQIYCTIYLDVEYLLIVAEKLPKGKEANESNMCPYMGKGEQEPRMTKGQTSWYLGEVKKLPDAPEQVTLLWDEKQRGFLSRLILNQARPCFVSKIRLDGVCLGWCGHGPDGLSLTKEGMLWDLAKFIRWLAPSLLELDLTQKRWRPKALLCTLNITFASLCFSVK